MKNTHGIGKVLLVSILFLSLPILLKADEPQKDTESNEKLERIKAEIQHHGFENRFARQVCSARCKYNFSEDIESCKSSCASRHEPIEITIRQAQVCLAECKNREDRKICAKKCKNAYLRSVIPLLNK